MIGNVRLKKIYYEDIDKTRNGVRIAVLSSDKDFVQGGRYLKPESRAYAPIEFRPGINVLTGANGSGKSTLLGAIAQYMLCWRRGRPHVESDDLGYRKAIDIQVEHDGAAIYYMHSNRQEGTRGVGLWDYENLGDWLQELHRKGSAGQKRKNRLFELLNMAIQKPAVQFPKMYSFMDHPVPVPDDVLNTYATDQKGLIPTLILDEPENSLDIQNMEEFLYFLRAMAFAGWQIIVATHHPLVMAYGDHFIDFDINNDVSDPHERDRTGRESSLRSHLNNLALLTGVLHSTRRRKWLGLNPGQPFPTLSIQEYDALREYQKADSNGAMCVDGVPLTPEQQESILQRVALREQVTAEAMAVAKDYLSWSEKVLEADERHVAAMAHRFGTLQREQAAPSGSSPTTNGKTSKGKTTKGKPKKDSRNGLKV